MQKITPFLWYDTQAREAAEFYVDALGGDSKILSSYKMSGTPSGEVEVLSVNLLGTEFGMMSAGPLFAFNPGISFVICCKTVEEVDAYWAKLSVGGTALMPLDKYPFSARYGWIQDKYGLGWQVMHMGDAPVRERIVPKIMFVDGAYGKAEEAMNFYISVFPNAKVNEVMRWTAGQEPNKEGTIKHATFTLAGREMAVMDSGYKHDYAFNEAVSLVVHVEDQAELEAISNKLSAVPEAEQCGWLKDKFGISWQIEPVGMHELMANASPEKADALTQSMLKMKRLDLAELKRVHDAA